MRVSKCIKSVITLSLGAMFLSGTLAAAQPVSPNQSIASSSYVEPLDVDTVDTLKGLYKQLIVAENRHDLAAVKQLVWDSPSTLFVAKTATASEGNLPRSWGSDIVIQHFHDLYQDTFRIDPDYSKEKVVGLTIDVAETYVPVKITVAYAGQTPVPKPFLMILDWVRTPIGWKMATDIALPIPPAPPQSN